MLRLLLLLQPMIDDCLSLKALMAKLNLPPVCLLTVEMTLCCIMTRINILMDKHAAVATVLV